MKLSEKLINLGITCNYPECVEAADALDAQERALAEIREVWAGSECGEPVHAQEAYAIHLCKQMYQIACDALAGKALVASDNVNRLRVRSESQRIKIKELESKLAANFCAYADNLKAASGRIKRLEEALRPHACGCKPERRGGECINHGPMESCSNYRARAALKVGE